MSDATKPEARCVWLYPNGKPCTAFRETHGARLSHDFTPAPPVHEARLTARVNEIANAHNDLEDELREARNPMAHLTPDGRCGTCGGTGAEKALRAENERLAGLLERWKAAADKGYTDDESGDGSTLLQETIEIENDTRAALAKRRKG